MTIEELFSHINDGFKVDNPFESSKSDLLLDQLNRKFITPNYDKSFDEGTEAETLIVDLINSERERELSQLGIEQQCRSYCPARLLIKRGGS